MLANDGGRPKRASNVLVASRGGGCLYVLARFGNVVENSDGCTLLMMNSGSEYRIQEILSRI